MARNFKRGAAKWARDLFEKHAAFRVLDLETTGMGREAEPVSIAVIDAAGEVLLDTLVCPTVPIEPGAARVHGIVAEMVHDAPLFGEVYDQLVLALGGLNEYGLPALAPVVIYNVDFDVPILMRAAKQIDQRLPAFNWQCAMRTYAPFYGEWSSYRGSYKWQSLENAMRQQRIDVDAPAHSALGDCQRVLALLRKMAEWEG